MISGVARVEKCQKVSTRESYQVEQMLSQQEMFYGDAFLVFSNCYLCIHHRRNTVLRKKAGEGVEEGEREATNEWTDKHLIEPRKEGRKRMSCPVARRPIFVPSRPPSFAFSAIVAVSCFPGMLLRNKEAAGGRG